VGHSDVDKKMILVAAIRAILWNMVMLVGRRQKDDFGGGAKAKARKLRYRNQASGAIPGERYWPRDRSIKIGLSVC
jgi:hypothetical protein